MLRIRNVEYGVPEFGSAAGQRGLLIEVYQDTNTEAGYDSQNPYNVPVYEDFKKTLEKKGLSSLYSKAIDGSQGLFLYWRGGSIEEKESSVEFDLLVRAISQDSITLQKELMKTKGDFSSAMLSGGIRPPYMVFEGRPKVFSGIRDFYQNFNVVFLILDGEDYSEVAFREMLNHQNSIVLIRASSVDDLAHIPDKVGIRKVSVLDSSSGSDVYEKCLALNYRYYRKTDGGPTFLF